METTAVFTITKCINGYNFRCKRYNRYNRFEVPERDLFKTMEELADIFNNVLLIGLVFEIG